MRGISVVAAALAVAACAGSPGPLACAEADWFSLGQEDGLVGARKGAFKSRADQCEDADAPVRRDLYDEGYGAGLAAYCTAAGGFHAGRDALKYEDVCAAEETAAFLTAYGLGEKLRRMEAAAEDAASRHQKALKDFDMNKFSLKVARNRLNDPYAAGSDVTAARSDVEYHVGELRRLDAALPKLSQKAATAAAELAAYKAELVAAGLISSTE
ncbi:MAG: DUF2799 domain-containing protein [Pseudomonadota bacterium]